MSLSWRHEESERKVGKIWKKPEQDRQEGEHKQSLSNCSRKKKVANEEDSGIILFSDILPKGYSGAYILPCLFDSRIYFAFCRLTFASDAADSNTFRFGTSQSAHRRHTKKRISDTRDDVVGMI